MSEYAGFAFDDEQNSPLSEAERLLASVLASTDASKIFDAELLIALARAGTVKQYEAKRRLQAKWPKDFHIREWWARLREQEEGLRREQLPAGGYILNNEGVIKANLANAIIMLRGLPVAYDEFACRPILTGPLPWRLDAQGTAWLNNDDVKSAEWCQHQRLEVGKLVTGDAVGAVGRERPVHPPRDYLASLSWDGECRLDHWLSTFMHCEDSPYVRNVAAKWLISAVKRVMEPGCQADYTLVLEGEQGKRKSSALRGLAGKWFSDDVDNIGSKDSSMQLQGNWIVEVSELDAFRRAESTTINAWLTRREDKFRPPYGARVEDFKRQNVFAASTNHYTWGKDDSGLRRFWPVRVPDREIDLAGIMRVRDQIWAEAFFRYGEGESIYMSGHAEEEATEQQRARQDRDVWSDQVEEWLSAPFSRSDVLIGGLKSGTDRVYVAELMQHCLQLGPRDQTHAAKLRLARILRLAGYSQSRNATVGEDGKRLEYWRPMRVKRGDWG